MMDDDHKFIFSHCFLLYVLFTVSALVDCVKLTFCVASVCVCVQCVCVNNEYISSIALNKEAVGWKHDDVVYTLQAAAAAAAVLCPHVPPSLHNTDQSAAERGPVEGAAPLHIHHSAGVGAQYFHM